MEKVFHSAEKRGKGEHGWLSTRYSFSFADWYEPTRMGFGALRVINDDRIAPASGFGMHSHRDMEIITIVTEGAVTHEDNLGNAGTVPAGDVQVMSAGTGVTHSERNLSPDVPLSLFQIWIETKSPGARPRYAQKAFNLSDAKPGETLIVSPDGREGSLSILQDAFISEIALDPARPFSYAMKRKGNGAYVFIIDGTIEIGGVRLGARDALGVSDTDAFAAAASAPSRALIIEVPMG